MENQFPSLPLANTSIILHGEKRHFRAETARLTPHGKHRVRLTLEGPNGSVEINLPRRAFWSLTSRLHEQSASADFGEHNKPRRKPS